MTRFTVMGEGQFIEGEHGKIVAQVTARPAFILKIEIVCAALYL
ncbi:hypothetical protein APED_24795 [Acanthopleuribacter pedis]